MKRIITIIKNNTFGIIIGIIICSAIVVLADTITSSMVEYDTTNSKSAYNTVQGAIDDLYTKVPISAGLKFVASQVPGLSTELIAELYRYQGTTADNYICFGTTDKTTCTGEEDDPDRYDRYMYRIIGIDASGRMKLIKKEALNTAHKWHSGYNVTWPQSSLYADLNGSYFLTNPTYIPDSSWSERIETMPWHYWSGSNANVTAASMASTELGAATVNAKIGLMYLHDYYYGLVGGNDCGNSSNQVTCRSSWIYLFQAQNDSSAPNTSNEWIISRRTTSNAFYVNSDGYVANTIMEASYSVRPVFYLAAGEVIDSGTGTLADPYILQ